jgi:CheY-like chemotaxis protein
VASTIVSDISDASRDGRAEVATPGFLTAGGELGELIRNFDWTATPLEDDPAALELLEREIFDAMVTDLMLSGMGGSELVAHAAARRPALRVGVASGYTVPAYASDNPLARAVFLRKPYDDETLDKALQTALQTDICSRVHF